MQKASRNLFVLLKRSFMITAVSLFLAWLGGEYSFFEMVFGLIGFYGFFLTVFLFCLHILFWILSFIFRNDNSEA